MVGNGHRLEGDLLCVFEERVRPPDATEPVDGEEAVLAGHVVGEHEPVVLPLLREEHVGRVCLEEKKTAREMSETCF